MRLLYERVLIGKFKLDSLLGFMDGKKAPKDFATRTGTIVVNNY